MEFLRLNNPEQPPAARPQHLKFARDLMAQKIYGPMVEKMPPVWRALFEAIQDGNDTYKGQPILRSDVNKIVNELKKCQPRKREDTYKHDFKIDHAPGKMFDNPTHIGPDRPPVAPRNQFATDETPQPLQDGMYRRPKDGKIFKVYHTVHGANVQVAKELIVVHEGKPATVTFEYRGRRPLYTLSPKMRLTIEEARDFGALYGTCAICGRTLTNELSIHLGIGPVCGRREFGGDFEFMVDDARNYIDGEVISVNYDDEIAKIDAQMKELEE
jgi:hypothetical protein